MRIIIVGGTGMLAKASREISHFAKELILMARNPISLAESIGARPLELDWRNEQAVKASIAKLELEPKVDLLLSWIHEEGLWCLPLFENLLVKGGRSIRIHGSEAGNPADGIKTDPAPPRKDIVRQNVVLGWIEEIQGQRWLTHEEISYGTIAIFKDPKLSYSIIGQIDSTINKGKDDLSYKKTKNKL